MNTLWKPSGLRSHSARSAGSKACASTPLLFSAASTALPERNEISLSDEGPPISTATFPNSLIRFPRPATTHNVDGRLLRPPAPAASRYRVGLAQSAPPPFRTRSFGHTDDSHFGLQHDSGLVGDHIAHMRDQRFNMGCLGRSIRVDDEIRMLLRNGRAADGVALEATGFDQSRRVIAFRVTKHRAGGGQVQRLRRDTFGEQLLDAYPGAGRVTVRKAEPRRGEYAFDVAAIRTQYASVGDRKIPGLENGESAFALGELDLRHVPPSLAAVAAGVHRQRPADRARHASKEFGLGAIVHRRKTGELRACHTRLRVHETVGNRQHASRRMHENDSTAHAPVANQQVAAKTDDREWLAFRQLAQECCEVVAVRWSIGQVRLAAAAPGDVSRERLPAAPRPPPGGAVKGGGAPHVLAATSGDTCPMEPAPIVRTTSPSRAMG